MKTVFIYNEHAGKKKGSDATFISQLSERGDSEISVYTTKSVGDAEEYVKIFCDGNGCARFVACGGDGTLCEVLNGVMEREGCEVALLPMGTGNDFCRNFDSMTVDDILSSDITKCDAVKCTLTLGDKKRVVYSANMVNIGFDCNAADMTSSMKKKPFISGTLAYVVSVLVTLIKKKGASLLIEADGKVIHNGELLLTTAANGCFCGGGFMSNPHASLCDGLIDVNIIKNISRSKFITLLPSYKKGTFLNKKGIGNIISALKCKMIKYTSLTGTVKVCIDGEIYDADGMTLEIVPEAFKFAGQIKSV